MIMKDLLKHPFVLTALWFFVVVIVTVSLLLSWSKESVTIDTSAGQIVETVGNQVDNILTDTPEIAQETDAIIPEAPIDDIWTPLVEEEYSLWALILDNFWPMIGITSPYTLTWKAPRSWFFEWSFPVTLMTLGEDMLYEAPATGAWLEAIWDSDELWADDMIDFSATIEFIIPEDSTGEAKIRFTREDMSWETDGEYIEEQVFLLD